MRKAFWLMAVGLLMLRPGPILAQDAASSVLTSDRVKEMEAKLDSALKQLAATQAQVQELKAQVSAMQSQPASPSVAAAAETAKPEANPGNPQKGDVQAKAESPVVEVRSPESAFLERVIDPGLGGDERKNELTAKPELFVQARYQSFPENGATVRDFASNFRAARVEAHWSGRIAPRFGAGFEIQYHPANDGDATQIINDAFIQFYPTDHVTITGGQFVLPFGFDNQQSSSVREAPERAMFVGFFFPGHRDRGLLLQGDLDAWKAPALKNVQWFVGVFNGNRFWADNNRQLNYNFRLRKRLESLHLAFGISGQVGHQILPPGVLGTNDQNIIGMDMQYGYRRFGLRAEIMAGNMPSTLLSLTPVFAPAFRPGRHSAGGAVLGTFRLTAADNVYARYDQFNGDPVTNFNVRAFDVGYFRILTDSQRIGFAYMHKNHLSFNDDSVNSRLQITWSATF